MSLTSTRPGITTGVSGSTAGVATCPGVAMLDGPGDAAAIGAGVDANEGVSIATDAGIGRQPATNKTTTRVDRRMAWILEDIEFVATG